VKVGIITISDRVSLGQAEDLSGIKIKELLEKIGGEIVEYEVIPDEKHLIEQEIIRMVDKRHLELVVTTGGTGLSRRDVTPEATLSVVDKIVPGMSEIMRVRGFEKTPHSVLSRGICGIRDECMIVNLPGSPKAVTQCLEVILPCLPHGIDILKGRSVSHEPVSPDSETSSE
jgi:molybdenum cofactor synthesis domain-containing protein